MTIQMIAGLDVGNGYVKGIATKMGEDMSKALTVDIPSVISYKTPVVMRPKVATDEYISALNNELDATITSNALTSADEGRMFFGQRAIHSGESLREFNISDVVSKSNDPLSTLLILGSIASLALRMYWRDNKSLPDTLDVDAIIGIALPIGEFMDYKDVYPAKLCNSNHMVTIRNFEKDIPVTIKFSTVIPIAEGAAAQFAITELGANFLQMALDGARAQGIPIDAGYTGDILAKATNTIGVDIGEGNVNFPVFTDKAVNVEASSSINEGYGTVLTNVVTATRNIQGLTFDTRKDLADFMLDDSMMPGKLNRRNRLQGYIDENIKRFVNTLMVEFTRIFRKVGARTDAVYVYGGGANAVKDFLYEALVKAVTYDDGASIPVIYLDSSYSRDLNRNGLYRAACEVAKSVWAQTVESPEQT